MAFFAVLAEFERELIRERTVARLKAAGARGRKGGRKFAVTNARVRVALTAMASRDTSVAELCRELGSAAWCSTGMSPLQVSSGRAEGAFWKVSRRGT